VHSGCNWVSPTGFVDPDTGWIQEDNAYDGILDGLHATTSNTVSAGSFFPDIEFTHAAIACSGIRYVIYATAPYPKEVSTDIYYGAAWHEVKASQTAETYPTWNEVTFDSQTITAIRFRIKNVAEGDSYCFLYEVDFGRDTDTAGNVVLLDQCTDFPNDIDFTSSDGSTDLEHDILGSDATLAKFLITVKEDLGTDKDIYIYWGKSGGTSQCSEFREDFSGYDETDPDTTITKTATKVTFTALEKNSDAYVYKDKTANYFAGSLEHIVKFYYDAADDGGFSSGWTLANLVDDWKGITDASGDLLSLRFANPGGDTKLVLNEVDGGTEYTDTLDPASFDTPYYIKIVRDESVGTYGTLYAYIYSDEILETLLDTLTLTLHTSKKDYQYIYATQSVNAGDANKTNTGYVENLFCRQRIDSEPVVGTPGSLEKAPGRLVYGGLVNSGLVGGKLIG